MGLSRQVRQVVCQLPSKPNSIEGLGTHQVLNLDSIDGLTTPGPNHGVAVRMKTPLEKVQDLISLALDGGPNQEECRNAAMQAVRLIRKHDLLVGEFSVKKLRRTTEIVSAQRTKKLAEEKARQVVSDLVRKSILGEFPIIQATQVTEDMHQSGVITGDQKETFYKQLRVCLLEKVRHGVLVSKSGWQGGYQLARSGK